MKPVLNAFRILRYLSDQGRPTRVTQIARDLNLNNSTCFNIMRTMASEDIVEFDDVSKTYGVGAGLVTLVKDALSDNARIRLVRAPITVLANKYSVTVTLWRHVSRNRLMLLLIENGSGKFHVDLPVGQTVSIFLGATGRAVAGRMGLKKDQLRAKFKPLRWARPVGFDTYWNDAQLAVQRRWAMDDGFQMPGVLSVAAPMFDTAGLPRYSLVAFTFREQHDENLVSRLGGEMSQLAERLAAQLC